MYSNKYQSIAIAFQPSELGEIDTPGAEYRLFIMRGIRYVRHRFVTIIVIFIAILIAHGRQGGDVR